MELQFTQTPVQYLCAGYHECKKQEETLETIVPDSFPDVQRILCTGADAVVRSRESHSGGAAVSGGINARVLYMAEGETQPRCLPTYLPFHVKADSVSITDDSRILFRVHVLQADARMLNSRKIALRVTLCWELTAYDLCTHTQYSLEDCPRELQTKTAEYDLLLPAETAECTFQMTEELHLPTARPMTGELMQFLPRLEITEQRLAGNKAVFKGNVHIRAIYGTEDGPAVYETELPFSQFCQLQEVYDEEELELWPVLTSCEVDKTLQQEDAALCVSLQILVQCVVKNSKQFNLVEDAYCTCGQFRPQWEGCKLPGQLDCRRELRTVRESREGDVSDILSIWVSPDLPELQRQGEQVTVMYPMTVNVLYLNSEKMPHFMSFRTQLQEDMKLCEKGKCAPGFAWPGAVTAVPTGSGVELRFPVSIAAACYAENEFHTLCGGELDLDEKPQARPSVIARRTAGGEPLWDIAKQSRTTVEKIRRANGMTSDVTEAGVLLIPT